MRITINPVLDMETLRWVSNDGVYDYRGLVLLACSSGGEVAKTDEALQKAEAAQTNTLNADYGVTFAEQQAVLGNVKARMNYMASNPLGYTPQQMHTATTSINDQVSTAAKQAIGSAAAFAARHGGADIGGGTMGQVAGEVAGGAATAKAQELASLSQQSEELKQQNMWKALGGLSQVGAEYGGAGGTAIGGAGAAAGEAVQAGQGATAAREAGWAGVGAIAGLVKAGASMFAPIKIQGKGTGTGG